MHKLADLHIQNFKSIKDLSLVLSNYTPLVGYNNAGKSNILEAIEWFLKPYKIDQTFFNDDRKGEPIRIKGTIKGVTEELLSMLLEKHRKSIEGYIVNDTEIVFMREMEKPDTASKVDLYVYSEEIDDFKKNPTGINNAIGALFPESIFIRAMDDASEDISKSKTTTTIGKILKEITEPIAEKYSDEINESLGKIHSMFTAQGQDRVEDLKELDKAFADDIANFFPGIKLQVDIPPPTIEDIFLKGSVKVGEFHEDSLRDFDSLGHGAQRSIQMALIKYLSEYKREDGDSVSKKFLLIEEPELYLHPQAITYLSLALKKLSKGNFQVIFATHSPIMISNFDVASTALIRKNVDRGTYKENTLNEALQEIDLEGGVADILFRLDNFAQILFADKVVLIEGKTEKKIVPFLFNMFHDLSSEQTKIGFVELQGASGIKNASRILESMGVKYKVLADLDFCVNHSIKQEYMALDNPVIEEMHDAIEMHAEKVELNLQGDWRKGNGGISAKKVEKLLDHAEFKDVIPKLQNELISQKIWVWKYGTIEKTLGINGKTDEDREEFLVQIKKTKNVEEVVENYDELNSFLDWILD